MTRLEGAMSASQSHALWGLYYTYSIVMNFPVNQIDSSFSSLHPPSPEKHLFIHSGQCRRNFSLSLPHLRQAAEHIIRHRVLARTRWEEPFGEARSVCKEAGALEIPYSFHCRTFSSKRVPISKVKILLNEHRHGDWHS